MPRVHKFPSLLLPFALALISTLATVMPAASQIAFDVTSQNAATATGGIDVDGDGVSNDGTWQLDNNAQGFNALNPTGVGGIAGRYRLRNGNPLR